MQSRAAEQVDTAKSAVNGLKTLASYLPDALQKMAIAMPFPASAVAAVMASAWIYQRDTRVLNSLNAFADLMQPHILEHNLIGKQLATNICLQRESELLALAAQTNSSTRFANITASVNKLKDFAVKHNLSCTNHWQSPMALQALEDLNVLQKGVLQISAERETHYHNLRTASTPVKTDFLLKLLGLKSANIQLPVDRKPAAVAVVSSGISPHDFRQLESKLSQTEQKLASVATVAQHAKRTATAADKKATNVENRFDLLAPESLHPVPVSAGRQVQLAAQSTTSQFQNTPAQLRQAVHADQQLRQAFTETAARLEDSEAETRVLRQTTSNLERQLSQSQAQIEAQMRSTAALQRQVQALLDAQNQAATTQLNNPPNPADGCCIIL